MPSARAKRKAKENANRRRRAAAGDVVNPYAVLEGEEGSGSEEEETEEKGGGDEGRPKTSYSDESGETLVDGAHDPNIAATLSTPTPHHPHVPKFTSRAWTYDDLPSRPEGFISPLSSTADPDEPLTEAELRHKEMLDWLVAQKGNSFNLKKATRERVVDFVYEMRWHEDAGEWMREVRLVVWRAVVRGNFWWRNPDTGEHTGKPEPIVAPTGHFECNFNLFVQCAAERLDRVGRDLPDPEYVQQIEAQLRLFFRRCTNNNNNNNNNTSKPTPGNGRPASYANTARPTTKPNNNSRAITADDPVRALEHLAFLLLVDEEQHRILSREEFATRLRICFDGVPMSWAGLAAVGMGEWPKKGHEVPARTEGLWKGLVGRFGL